MGAEKHYRFDINSSVTNISIAFEYMVMGLLTLSFYRRVLRRHRVLCTRSQTIKNRSHSKFTLYYRYQFSVKFHSDRGKPCKRLSSTITYIHIHSYWTNPRHGDANFITGSHNINSLLSRIQSKVSSELNVFANSMVVSGEEKQKKKKKCQSCYISALHWSHPLRESHSFLLSNDFIQICYYIPTQVDKPIYIFLRRWREQNSNRKLHRCFY